MAKYKVAIASTDLKNIDLHFGKCNAFTIAEVNDANKSYRLGEQRAVPALCSSCGAEGDTDRIMDGVIDVLSDCRFVVVSRMGRWPFAMLYAKGIESIEFYGPIDDALKHLCAQTSQS
jgi:predicted Fe-Mo cluster-binding NifX family protein